MTGSKIACLADRILDDRRMIPRAWSLLDRIALNAEAIGCAGALPAPLAYAWGALTLAAIAFCERLAARHGGRVVEEAFSGLELSEVVFDDGQITTLRHYKHHQRHGAGALEALDIVRQCRHIQALIYVEDLADAA